MHSKVSEAHASSRQSEGTRSREAQRLGEASPKGARQERQPNFSADEGAPTERERMHILLLEPCVDDYREVYAKRFKPEVHFWADDELEIPSLELYLSRRSKRLENPHCIERIILCDGQRIGTVSAFGINPLSRDCSLGIVIVDQAYWGRGIGTVVLRAFLELLRNRGIRFVYLETFADNLRAQRAFERVGFVPGSRFIHEECGREVLTMNLRLFPKGASIEKPQPKEE
jgi:RimJ/RimL family protein N-acetyltransferase